VLCQRTLSSVLGAVLHSYTAQFNLQCMGPFTYKESGYYTHRMSLCYARRFRLYGLFMGSDMPSEQQSFFP